MNTLRAVPFAFLLPLAAAAGQSSVPFHYVPCELDSGHRDHPGREPAVVYRDEVRVANSTWLRLEFRDTHLPPGSRLRLRSEEDGAVQWFDARSLRDYSHGSAYFNGDAVSVELWAAPASRDNRVRVSRVLAGSASPGGLDTLCGGVDERVPSRDHRQGRQWPTACTAWLVDATTVVTAGHCVNPLFPQQVHFNVPPSTSTGGLQLPPPEDQFAYDMLSLRWMDAGLGADWAVVSTVRNSNTGLFAGQSQGSWYSLGDPSDLARGQPVRVTGYGQTGSPTPPERNQTQSTMVGPFNGIDATTVFYGVDTTTGNSGSPVLDERADAVVGIHTNGGCGLGDESNKGTRIDLPALQLAIDAVRSLRTAGAYVPFGQACAGTGGTPSLTGGAFPHAGAPMVLEIRGCAPHRMGCLFFGASDSSWMGRPLPWPLGRYGLTGCTLYAGADVTMPLLTDGAGEASLTFTIPGDVSLVGGAFYNQFASADPGANPGGATLTNGAVGTVGEPRTAP